MKDNLARETYAEKIATEIADHYCFEKEAHQNDQKKERENIVFAISGKWGEGKTTLLSFLEDPLIKRGFKIVKFNPWKYSQEDITLKRSFLRAIKDQLGSLVSLDDLYYDRTKTTLNVNWEGLFYWACATIFFIFFAIPLFLHFNIHDWVGEVINTIKRFLESPLAIPIITAFLIPTIAKVITFNRRSANIATAEEFEDKFKKLLVGMEKIVFFIDDLDRCSPKKVKIILDSLGTFFQHPECSFIITGDHTVIERYAGDELELSEEISQQKKLQEGRRFLKKLFDVYWRLPLSTPYQFGIFINEEIKGSKINFNEGQLKNLKLFLADDSLFERNPRHVKRFLTKLRFALDGVNLQKKAIERIKNKEESIKDSINTLKDILANPDLLAKILLIEEFFHPLYEKLILYPEELVAHEKSLRSDVNSNELKIATKTVLSILDEKGKDTEYLEKYISLVKRLPKFTDEDNSTLHEVASYFSFSGSTGLPSLLGPDESNFEQFIKGGQLADKLGAILTVAKKGKKKSFLTKALVLFDQSTEPTEKLNIVREGLKLSLKLDEWAEELPSWKEKLFALQPDQQNLLAREFWLIILQKKPKQLAIIKSENPTYFESIWEILKTVEIKILHPDTVPELEKIVKELAAVSPENFKGVEIFLQKIDSEEIKKQITTQLDSPDKCKTYIEHMKAINFAESKVSEISISRLRRYLSDFNQLDWAIENKVFLKSIDLFGLLNQKVIVWAKDAKQLIKISDQKDGLELTDDNIRQIAETIPTLIKKSADVQFLNNNTVQSFLNKDQRINSFQQLKEVLTDTGESLEKRKEVAQLLIKNDTLWNGLEINNIYEVLKGIKKLKFTKVADLKGKPKEIIDSWGFNDSSK